MTRAQRRAFVFIRDFIRANGCSPTYEQIKVGLNLKSKGAAFGLIIRLANAGYISFDGAVTRKIKISNVCCPACGAVLARDELDKAA